MKSLQDLLVDLQQTLAHKDCYSNKNSQRNSALIEFLILKKESLKIKMYQEVGHQLPHVHIDYPQKNHSATLSIKPAKRIAGDIVRNHETWIVEWINNNTDALLQIWDLTQAGKDALQLIAEVKENRFY